MAPHSDDLALVRGAVAGDAGALARLEERLRFVPRVLAVLNRRFGRALTDHDLEDVAQDAVIVIWTKLREYSGQARLETWLYPFCVNVLRNAGRKKQRRTRRQVDESRVPEAGVEAPRPASDFAHVHRALDRLGPPASDIVRQRVFEERSFPEIAARMSVPVATVKTWFYRGVESLRFVLGGAGDEE